MNRRLEVTLEDVSKMPILLCTAGVREEKEIFDRAHESLANHYMASHAFEQLHNLLELQDVIDRVQDDPVLLERPIAELASAPVKRSLVIRDTEAMISAGRPRSTLGPLNRMSAHPERVASTLSVST